MKKKKIIKNFKIKKKENKVAKLRGIWWLAVFPPEDNRREKDLTFSIILGLSTKFGVNALAVL